MPDRGIVIDPRAMGCPTGEHRCPRRIADRGGTVGVGEQQPAAGEAIQVRGLDVRMATEAADPVVHVVDDDHQHVGPQRVGRLGGRLSGGTVHAAAKADRDLICEAEQTKGRGLEACHGPAPWSRFFLPTPVRLPGPDGFGPPVVAPGSRPKK